MQIRNVFSLVLYVSVFSVCTYYNFLEKTETTMHYLLSALMLLFFFSCIAVLGVMINKRSIQGARTYPTGRLFRALVLDGNVQQQHFSNFIEQALNLKISLNKGQTKYSYLTAKDYTPEEVRALLACLNTHCDQSIMKAMEKTLNVRQDRMPAGIKNPFDPNNEDSESDSEAGEYFSP